MLCVTAVVHRPAQAQARPSGQFTCSVHSLAVHVLASFSPETLLGDAASTTHLASAAAPSGLSSRSIREPCWVLPQAMRTWPAPRRRQAPPSRS